MYLTSSSLKFAKTTPISFTMEEILEAIPSEFSDCREGVFGWNFFMTLEMIQKVPALHSLLKWEAGSRPGMRPDWGNMFLSVRKNESNVQFEKDGTGVHVDNTFSGNKYSSNTSTHVGCIASEQLRTRALLRPRPEFEVASKPSWEELDPIEPGQFYDITGVWHASPKEESTDQNRKFFVRLTVAWQKDMGW